MVKVTDKAMAFNVVIVMMAFLMFCRLAARLSLLTGVKR
ncbi:hypothetical protein [Escherichia phage A221]|nr:hypothetical protein [Escherichia phage A221]